MAADAAGADADAGAVGVLEEAPFEEVPLEDAPFAPEALDPAGTVLELRESVR